MNPDFISIIDTVFRYYVIKISSLVIKNVHKITLLKYYFKINYSYTYHSGDIFIFRTFYFFSTFKMHKIYIPCGLFALYHILVFVFENFPIFITWFYYHSCKLYEYILLYISIIYIYNIIYIILLYISKLLINYMQPIPL